MNKYASVLYVEDCEETVHLFKLCLNKYSPETNITLDVVNTVSEAIKRFSPNSHVAALIDWNLPDGEGIEVAQYIRELHDTLPIIFLSALFLNEHLQVAKQYNPTDCLVKEYSNDFISTVIHHIPMVNS